MNSLQNTRAPYPFRIAGVALFLLVTSALTTTAYTSDAPMPVTYVCAQGDRFTVEYHGQHARLRHGTGVFVLSKEAATDGSRYSDGRLMLWTHGEEATLEPGGPTSRGVCIADEQRV